MTYISPFPANTPRERDLSLAIARATARDIRKKIEICRDPSYTQLDPVFVRKLEDMLDEYTVEIKRLTDLRFVRHGVVEL